MTDERPLTESQLLARILIAFGGRPEVRLWRAQPLVTADRSGRMMRALPKGHPDLCGFLRPSGRMVMLEVKSAKGRLSPEQRAWAAVLTAGGVCYAVVRSLDDVAKALGLKL